MNTRNMLSVLSVVVLILLAMFFINSQRVQHGDAGVVPSITSNASPAVVESPQVGQVSTSGIPKQATATDVFARFDGWLARYRATGTPAVGPLQEEGVALAKERRSAFRELIRSNPRAAVERALSPQELAAMPETISMYLERHIGGSASSSMFSAGGIEHYTDNYRALMVRGEVLNSYVYGNRNEQLLFQGDEIHGVAVGPDMAVEDAAQIPSDILVKAGLPGKVTEGVVKTTVTFSEKDLEFSKSRGYDTVSLKDGTMREDNPGTPWLPARSVNILLPAGALVQSVSAVGDEALLRSGFNLMPVQPPVPTLEDIKAVFVERNAQAYGSTSKFPASLVNGNAAGRQKGWTTISVLVNPVRYMPATQTLTLADKIEIKVSYELPPVPPVVLAGKKTEDANEVESRVVNPTLKGASPYYLGRNDWRAEEWLSGSNQDAAVQPLGGGDLPLADEKVNLTDQVATPPVAAEADGGVLPMGGTVDYVIITSDALTNDCAALKAYRESFNKFTVEIRSTTWITNNYSGAKPSGGTDTQTAIQNFIKDYVQNNGLKYVCIAGGNDVVDDRDCYVTCGSYIKEKMPTDSYWAGLDSSWDTNGDGVYGTPGEDDLYYDVIVGRITIRNATHLNDYVSKLINYETNPPPDLPGKFMMSGRMGWDRYTLDARPSDLMNDGHAQFRDANHPTVEDTEMWLRRKYRDYVQGKGWQADTVGYMCGSLTSWDTTTCGDYAAGAANMVTRFSEGWNLMLHDDHGVIDKWLGSNFKTTDASALTGLAAFIHSTSCKAAAWQATDPCLSESFIRNPNGGAIVYLGCADYGWGSSDAPPASNSGYGGASASYQCQWLNAIFGNKNYISGKAYHEAKQSLAGSSSNNGATRWVQFGLNHQGDPAAMIFGIKPMVSVKAIDPTAAEPGTDTASIAFERIGPTSSSLTVSYTRSGSASASTDFTTSPSTSASGSITIPAGTNRVVITLTAANDATVESDEYITFTVSPSANYTVNGVYDTATMTILDNDNSAMPTVSLAVLDGAATEQGPDPAVLRISRTGSASSAISVNYTLSGTASATDYSETLSGSATLGAGVANIELSITPVDDALPEGDETLGVTLTSGTGYTLGTVLTGTVTIAENDARPSLTVSAVDSSARENTADTANLRISRTGDTTLPLAVDYTLGGTASAADYTPTLGGTATIPAGTNALDIGITTINDSEHELPETLGLTLVPGPGYYSVGASSNATITIYDDDNTLPTVYAGGPQTLMLGADGIPAPVSGAAIYLNAALDNGANATWEDSQNKWNLSIDTGVTFVANAGSALPGITAAYHFPGGTNGTAGCDGASFETIGMDKNPITLELWFKPDASTNYPSNGQVLWETGGNPGFGIFYRNGSVEVAHDANAGQISANVSALINEFIQVVVTFDTGSSSSNFKLYINGVLKATGSRSDTDLSNTDGAALGNRGGAAPGGAGASGDANTASFEGKIAIFRAYSNRILNDFEVFQNYSSIAGPGGATTTLAGSVSDVDGDDITTTWTVLSGPGGYALANAAVTNTPAVFFTVGNYTLRLTAADGSGQTVSNDVVITVSSLTTLLSLAPESVSATNATLRASLHTSSTNYNVTVYYGTSNGGTNAGSWALSKYVGSWTNAATNLSCMVSSLLPETDYWYTFMASNATTTFWATPSVAFTTLADPNPPSVGAVTATDVTGTNAVLHAELLSTGTAATTVWCYWNPGSDPQDNVAGWQFSRSFGVVPGPQQLTNNTAETAVLMPGTLYYYRFAAVNSHGTNWSAADSFRTFAPPEVTSVGGGVALSTTSAALRGELTAGIEGTVYICWGESDMGTADRWKWDHIDSLGLVTEGNTFSNLVTELSPNTTYFYRCYAENAYGSDWSDTAETFSGTATNNVIGGRPWTPADAPNVIAWYDATDASTILQTGGVVTQWNDKVGGFNLIGSGDPNTGTRTINGLNVIDCDLNDSHTNASISLPADGSVSVFMLAAIDSADGANDALFTMVGNSNGYDLSLKAADTSFNGTLDSSLLTSAKALTGGPYAKSTNVWNVQYDPSGAKTVRTFINGNTNVTAAVTGGRTLGTSAQFKVGDRYSAPNQRLDGAFGEVLVASNMTVETRQKIEGYLAHKWGLTANLPSNHPYKDAPPCGTAGSTIANRAPTGIGEASATLNASLNTLGTNYVVTVYYGTTDGGTNAAMWTSSAYVGSWTNVSTSVSYTVIGFAPCEAYYYTFMASNAAGRVWASPSWTFCPPCELSAVTMNHAVPHAWLSAINSSWSTNYEAAAMSDPDNDGFTTWQEYWSGTDPQDSNSCLRIDSIMFSGTNLLVSWRHAAVNAGLPPITIQARTNLVAGSWVGIGSHAPTNGVNIWSAGSSVQGFYRLAVTNAP
jgi:Peptidase family C25/Propeptide_C25/Calx-beta domain